MNKDKFNSKLENLLKKMNMNIKEEQQNKFYNYMNILLEWNNKINLTAITEPNEIIVKHFIDSLTVLKYIEENDKIVDVGTGAGFPGIPIAIVKNKNEITLVDSLNKRIKFLEEVKKIIKADNVNLIHSRAEDFGQDKKYREKYDTAVSRAVANMNVLAEYLLPTVKIGGKVIFMKSNKIEDELEKSKFAIRELGGKIKSIEEIKLPETDINRKIIIIEKEKETPKKYPRRAGIPSKEPLN